MSTVDHDVDAYGMLDHYRHPTMSAVRATPGEREHRTVRANHSTKVDGSHNSTAGHDVNNYRIEHAVFGEPPSARVRKRSGRGLQDPEALQRLAKNFVPPAGLLDAPAEDGQQSALEILRHRKVLFLAAAERHCGQLAAGLRLGFELQRQHASLVVREELVDEDFTLSGHDLLVANEAAVVLVDLRGSGQAPHDSVHRGIVEFTRELEERDSYLIIVITAERRTEFTARVPGRVHQLGKPSSIEVLERYLPNIDVRGVVDAENATELLRRWWPPRIRELVDTVSDGDTRCADATEALRRALANEISGDRIDLRTVIRDKQQNHDAEWIALLLAAALLEESAPRHIVNAADEMLARNETTRVQLVPLLRPSPFMRLDRLDINGFTTVTGGFRQPGFGVRVLRHFWLEHPDLRETMMKWIGALPQNTPDLSSAELEQIADRAADLAVEGGHEIALKLAVEWSDTGVPTLRSVAVRLLTTVATDSVLGRDIRAMLWTWSRGERLNRHVLTAEVCAGIGLSFPRVALTRLKHLANSGNDGVRTSVLAALSQIGSDIGISKFLRYVSEWFDRATPTRLRLLSLGITSVLAGASEDLGADDSVYFWDRALATMAPNDLRTVVTGWIEATAKMPSERYGELVEPIVQAAKTGSHRIADAQYACRAGTAAVSPLSLGTDPVTDVRHRLLTRLDEVDPVLDLDKEW